MISQINTIMPMLKVSIYNVHYHKYHIVHPLGFATILMTVSTFKTAVILYLQYLNHKILSIMTTYKVYKQLTTY